MSNLEQEGRRLIAELAEYLRKCGAGEAAEAHLAAIVAIVRPLAFNAQISGKGEISVPLLELFGNRMEHLIAAGDRRGLDYSGAFGRKPAVVAGGLHDEEYAEEGSTDGT